MQLESMETEAFKHFKDTKLPQEYYKKFSDGQKLFTENIPLLSTLSLGTGELDQSWTH